MLLSIWSMTIADLSQIYLTQKMDQDAVQNIALNE